MILVACWHQQPLRKLYRNCLGMFCVYPGVCTHSDAVESVTSKRLFFLFMKFYIHFNVTERLPCCDEKLQNLERWVFRLVLRIVMAEVCWLEYTPDSKIHGTNMGPPGSCRPQMGPMLAPRTLLSGSVTIPEVWCNVLILIKLLLWAQRQGIYKYIVIQVQNNWTAKQDFVK